MNSTMRTRLLALPAVALLLLVGSARADGDDDDDTVAAPAGDVAELPALPVLPELPTLAPTPTLEFAPAPESESAPAPAPSSSSLLHVPAVESAVLGQYDEYRRPVAAFVIDARPVSSSHYDACVTSGRCTAPSCRPPSPSSRVTCVDVAQASAYCAYAGGRLPTEEEWEHAARDARSLGMEGTDDAAEWTSSPYCYFCNHTEQVVRGGPARNPGLRGWRAPAAKEQDLGFRCARSG